VVGRPLNEAAFGDLVHTIYEDREHNLWVGGRDGLYRLSPSRFSTYAVRQGLTYNNVMSVCEDRSGAVWIGTWGGGLNQIVGDKVTAYGKTNGLTDDLVLALHEARDGSLWIGMEYTGGLNRFRPGERTNSFPRENGPTDQVRVIAEDRQGALWVGTSVGLRILRDGKTRSYSTANGLAGNLVMAIYETLEGTIWIGTDGGLSRWQAGRFTNFTTHEGLPVNAVNAIYEDRQHILWIGTKGGGLVRMEGDKFTNYTTRQGLFSDEIYEIVEDDSGYFWMSCRSGIFRIKKADVEAFDHGERATIPCISFGKADGLLTVQCNGVAKPSAWKGSEGKIWFPTIRGVVAVETRIETNDNPPPVMIEEIVADKKRVEGSLENFPGSRPAGRALSIPPGRGELEIRFTALSFQVPEKNRFRYQLKGIDTDWIEAGNRREVRYNNIGPGTYHFRVIASNNDGVWNETGASATLIFLPHFWQTWVFKCSVVAALGLLLTAWYRARVARLREIERLRIQIAADLHDDVGARLTKVAMVTEFVDRETSTEDRSKPHIQNIARTTREVIQAMDEIVWTINPKNDTLDNLANYVFQYAQDYFQNTGVRCRMDLPARLPDYHLPTEERHNLFMAVKEALNNVLKHSAATEVRIRLGVEDGRLCISIADNGRGFRVDQVNGVGNGLTNMKERLQRIGGRMSLESEPGNGTRIRMEADTH
jgi:signal transduction histidine kinase/streptogramin lyase